MVQTQDARFAATVQRVNEDFGILDARREDLVAELNKNFEAIFAKREDLIAKVNKNFEGIVRRLDQLEQERGERQAATKGCNDAVMRLEKRQADTDERINELEWEMGEMTRVHWESCQTPWDELQTLDQTQSDVISNSNKDIHKGIHMEGKGEIHTPPWGA